MDEALANNPDVLVPNLARDAAIEVCRQRYRKTPFGDPFKERQDCIRRAEADFPDIMHKNPNLKFALAECIARFGPELPKPDLSQPIAIALVDVI